MKTCRSLYSYYISVTGNDNLGVIFGLDGSHNPSGHKEGMHRVSSLFWHLPLPEILRNWHLKTSDMVNQYQDVFIDRNFKALRRLSEHNSLRI